VELQAGLMRALNLLADSINVRHAVVEDCEALLEMMKKLAVFEDYINDFKVTVDDLIIHGFSTSQDSKPNVTAPNFTALVVEHETCLQGYLVYYLIPFTYDLKPTLFIKELYVDKGVRGQKVGKKLMEAAINDAKEKGCGRLKWDVLSDNMNAQLFYKSLGASYDERWQGFVLNV